MDSKEIVSYLSDEFDVVEVYLEEVKEKNFELENSKDYSKYWYENNGCGIRLIKDGSYVFIHTTIDDNYKDKLSKIVQQVKSNMKILKKEGVNLIPNIREHVIENNISSINEEDAKNMIYEMDKKAKNFDKRIAAVKNAFLTQTYKFHEIANSYGLFAQSKQTVFSSGVVVYAEDKRSEIGFYSYETTSFNSIDFNFIAEKAAQRAISKLYPQTVQPKKYSIILSNEVMVQLLSYFFKVFNAYSLIDHTTALEERENTNIFSDNITIIDDNNFSGRPSFGFDDEGIEHKSVTVVENGYFKTFLHNLYTSEKLSCANTANARRVSHDAIPMVGPGIFYIKPGNDSLDDLFKTIDGLYITDIMGLHMANNISGDFSFGVNGFFIYNGEAKFYFNTVSFAGNFFDMMNSVINISNSVFFKGSFGSCDIAIADCVIGSGN